MNLYLSILKWGFFALVSLLFFLTIALRFIDFSASEEDITEAFSKSKYSPLFKHVTTENREIGYVTVGDSSKQAVLFIHGSPGSWDNFLGLMSNNDLLDDFYFISIDRPGFGMSGEGNPERSLTNQSSDIAQSLVKENTSAIIVGHSYGGPVVVKMAIDFPELVDGLLIVAGSVDPELEKTKWFQIPVHYKILSWILPGPIYSTNEEILALKDELEQMKPNWKKITHPVSVIQGGQDNLVPRGNADFAQEMLVNTSELSMVEVPEMNHFVPWTHPELIINELYRMKTFLTDSSNSE